MTDDAGRSHTRDWRLHKHADYQRVYQASRKQFSTLLTYFVAPQSAESTGDVVLHPKRSVLAAEWPALRNEVRRIFVKIEESQTRSVPERKA
jgi:hypothetical protein